MRDKRARLLWSGNHLLRSRQAAMFSRARISKKNFSFEKKSFFFQLFNLMKWSRLTASSHLASSVLVSILSLFRCCLSSISSFSFSWSFSFSLSPSLSFSLSLECKISSMYDVFYLRFHLFLIIQCCFHLHSFELRRLASDESLKDLFSSVFSVWRTSRDRIICDSDTSKRELITSDWEEASFSNLYKTSSH
jgi:hypothetical protein